METNTTLTLDVIGWATDGSPIVRVVALTESYDLSGQLLDMGVKKIGVGVIPTSQLNRKKASL